MSAIVNNTNVNYTSFYNLLNELGDYCAQHPSITGVSTEDLSDFDEREFPSYPVANINVLSTLFRPTTTDFTIQIIIADKYKEKNNESDNRNNKQIVPFYGTDDKNDIWANTLAIMNDVTSYIQRGVQAFEINGTINCTKYQQRFDSGLAGWTIEFTLTTHNDRNRCLFDLYPN